VNDNRELTTKHKKLTTKYNKLTTDFGDYKSQCVLSFSNQRDKITKLENDNSELNIKYDKLTTEHNKLNTDFVHYKRDAEVKYDKLSIDCADLSAQVKLLVEALDAGGYKRASGAVTFSTTSSSATVNTNSGTVDTTSGNRSNSLSKSSKRSRIDEVTSFGRKFDS